MLSMRMAVRFRAPLLAQRRKRLEKRRKAAQRKRLPLNTSSRYVGLIGDVTICTTDSKTNVICIYYVRLKQCVFVTT